MSYVNARRVVVSAVSLAVIPASLLLAIHGPGRFPVAAVLGMFVLALVAWVLVGLPRANAWWATATFVATGALLGLVLLGMLPIPLTTAVLLSGTGVLAYMIGSRWHNRP